MFTDIKWKNDNTYEKGKGNSLVFKFDDNNLVVFNHNGKENEYEIYHSDEYLFRMYGGPSIRKNREADAYLGDSFIIKGDENSDRGTILAGEEGYAPKLNEVEVFKIEYIP